MSDISQFPDNAISKHDRHRLESFGGHEIAHGRATRWHWARGANGGDVFEIFKGGANEKLVVRIDRNRPRDVFQAYDPDRRLIGEGTLDHVMALLDEQLARAHGEYDE